MWDYQELCQRKDLEFWARMWPFGVAAAYILGLVLLNFFYYAGWGFTELGFSSALCTAAAVIALLTVLFALALKYLGNALIEWIEARAWRRRFVSVAVLAQAGYSLYSIAVGHPIRPSAGMQSFRIPAELGRMLIALVWYASIVYLVMILIAVWPRESRVQSRTIIVNSALPAAGANPWRKWIIFLSRFLLIPGLLAGVVAGFIDIYEVIGSRFGGGRPDSLLLWVSPLDLPTINALSWEQRDSVCPASLTAVYRGLRLVYEGSDYLVLAQENSTGTIRVSKELVKRRQWVVGTDQALLDMFEKRGINKSILCVPESSPAQKR
jgi:hypothetical protein